MPWLGNQYAIGSYTLCLHKSTQLYFMLTQIYMQGFNYLHKAGSLIRSTVAVQKAAFKFLLASIYSEGDLLSATLLVGVR
jgi:hypothetical protein